MKKIIGAVFGLVTLTGLLGLVSLAGLIFIPTLIVWLIYNHVAAPLLNSPQLGYWKCFLLLWLISIIGSWLRPK